MLHWCFGNHQRERNPLNYECALRSVEDHCKDLQGYWATPLLHNQSTKEQLYPCANFCILCILLQHVAIYWRLCCSKELYKHKRQSSSKTAFSLKNLSPLRQAIHCNNELFPLYFTFPTLPTTTFFFFYRARRPPVSLRSNSSFLSCD